MNKQVKNYSEEEIDSLIGQLAGTRYVKEVQVELAKMGETYSNQHVVHVFNKIRYTDSVMDAIKQVGINRKNKRRANAQAVGELVAQ